MTTRPLLAKLMLLALVLACLAACGKKSPVNPPADYVDPDAAAVLNVF